jgi:hypothetical protein
MNFPKVKNFWKVESLDYQYFRPLSKMAIISVELLSSTFYIFLEFRNSRRECMFIENCKTLYVNPEGIICIIHALLTYNPFGIGLKSYIRFL